MDLSKLTVEDVEGRLRKQNYLADRGLATAVFLMLKLGRPLLLEGEAGVGKTQLGKTVAELLGRTLIRLQCYEGIDSTQALYEWDFARQLLAARTGGLGMEEVGALFAPEFLIERPLLKAIQESESTVLLIDELDRSDDEFEAFLLEILSEGSITIPEVGTISATSPIVAVITSNRTRDLHDALKRRCLYQWIDHPESERELEIVRLRVPEIPIDLSNQLVAAVQRMRTLNLRRRPGVAETIDWAASLVALGTEDVTRSVLEMTSGSLIKDEEDREVVLRHAADVVPGP